jgi:hypothetical protein
MQGQAMWTGEACEGPMRGCPLASAEHRCASVPPAWAPSERAITWAHAGAGYTGEYCESELRRVEVLKGVVQAAVLAPISLVAGEASYVVVHWPAGEEARGSSSSQPFWLQAHHATAPRAPKVSAAGRLRGWAACRGVGRLGCCNQRRTEQPACAVGGLPPFERPSLPSITCCGGPSPGDGCFPPSLLLALQLSLHPGCKDYTADVCACVVRN